MTTTSHVVALLAFPFRPFFLLTGIYGVVTVAAWMSHLLGGIPLPVGWSSMHWHSHEMLFGLATAAIAGFLLTAMCNWTGAQPLKNWGLLGLIGVWIAGRVAMWTASWWPLGVVAVVDLLFLPLMAVYVLRVLLQHGNKRNLVLAGILILLSLANLMMHLGFIRHDMVWLNFGQLAAFNLIAIMMIIIGGRIIPLFTVNWLRNHGGRPEAVKTFGAVDRVAMIAAVLLIPADFFPTIPWLAGVTALVAAAAVLVRLAGWSGWQARREPLLWILHLGYAWIVLALLLKSAAAFNLVTATAWQHALGVGGMGTLILGIMTRVALGHTGRPLALPAFATIIYISITAAAIARVTTALQFVDYRLGLILAATGWAMAFGIFIVIYWPILSRPRADGRPG